MHAQDSVINDRRDGQHVEAKPKLFPDSHIISPLTLIVEPIHPVDALALVVASQQEKVVWELDLVGQQQADRLNRLLSPVDVVSNENKLLVARWIASDFEQPEQVKVLTVDISENLDGRLDIEQHLLLAEDLCALVDEELDGL